MQKLEKWLIAKISSVRVNLEILPYPIATSMRRIRACHDKDARRLKHVLQAAEMTARFFAIVVLCELRDLRLNDELQEQAALGRCIANLRRPSFGHWIELLREGSRTLANREEGFMPDLRQVVFGRKVGSPGMVLETLQELVTIRNGFAHGDMSPVDIQKNCDTAEELMKRLLGGFDFMEDYMPYYVKTVNVHRRHLDPLRYTHHFWLLAGPYQDPEAIFSEREWHTDTEDFILEREGGGFLNLHPLFIYLDNEKYDQTEDIRPDLYVFNGYEKGRQEYSVKFLPCGASGRNFDTKQLENDTERKLIERGLLELLELFEEAANSG